MARAWGALWGVAAVLLLATAAGQQDPQLARVACDARYSAPCSRSNSEFLAWDTARNFTAQLAAGTSSADVLAQITAGAFNIDVGFYPFVFTFDGIDECGIAFVGSKFSDCLLVVRRLERGAVYVDAWKIK